MVLEYRNIPFVILHDVIDGCMTVMQDTIIHVQVIPNISLYSFPKVNHHYTVKVEILARKKLAFYPKIGYFSDTQL